MKKSGDSWVGGWLSLPLLVGTAFFVSCSMPKESRNEPAMDGANPNEGLPRYVNSETVQVGAERQGMVAWSSTDRAKPKRRLQSEKSLQSWFARMFSTPRNREEAKAHEIRQVRTTAYCHAEADHIEYHRLTAAGTPLRFGQNIRSAAADWSRFPLGTQFKIMGRPEIYEIDDYGSALTGTETIDIYQPSLSSMRHWGVRNVSIEILRWGCFEKSLSIMKPRTKWKHVRQMVNDIESRMGV